MMINAFGGLVKALFQKAWGILNLKAIIFFQKLNNRKAGEQLEKLIQTNLSAVEVSYLESQFAELGASQSDILPVVFRYTEWYMGKRSNILGLVVERGTENQGKTPEQKDASYEEFLEDMAAQVEQFEQEREDLHLDLIEEFLDKGWSEEAATEVVIRTIEVTHAKLIERHRIEL